MIWTVTAGLFAGLVLLSELSHWVASARWPTRLDKGSPCAVIVLGFPSRRGGGLHPIQRWRTQIGVRTLLDSNGGCLVFSGTDTRGSGETEAATMARYASEHLGLSQDQVILEDNATNTWENIALSLRLSESYPQVAFVSDPLHAARARRYAIRQQPEVESRLVRARDYAVLERWWLKGPIACHELIMRVRDLRYKTST